MRKGDAKRQAILDTAQRLFFQKGFEQTSVQDILDVLQCSKGSFYHHFESKLSVLETLCTQRAQNQAALAEKAAMQCDGMERLNVIAYHLLPLRKGEEPFMCLMLPLSNTKEGVSLSYQYALALSQSFEPLISQAIARATEQGLCYPVKAQGVARVILLMLNQYWQEAAEQVMSQLGSQEPVEPADLLPGLELYRNCIERLLDAPYGSVELIDLEELSRTCSQALAQLRA